MESSTISATSIMIIDPKERMQRYGIECKGQRGDDIEFPAGQWRPGGEYIEKLTVRNVSTSVKKFKYKLPKSRYFSMAYPEVIILSPGMSKEIDVIFRPLEHEPYDDSIYIKMQEGPGSGGFHIPVRAYIDKLIVSAPFGIDLGYCPTHQNTSQIFQLSNNGEVDAPFRWELPPPFVLEPSSGVISAGKKQDITVTVQPLEASVFVSQATCYIGEGVHAIIPEPTLVTRISAIGKYAYIAVSDPEVDFGEVISGTPPESTKREIVLRNSSVVTAEFQLVRHDRDRDEVFEITPKSGIILPMSELPIVIKFSALAVGAFSLDRYTFKTPGNCRTVLTCKAMSMPPKVTLFKESFNAPVGTNDFCEGSPGNSINFRDLEVGSSATRVLYLKNESNRDTTFSIVADPLGVFHTCPTQGRLPALCPFVPVKLQFSPKKPMNYYRRIFVLLSDGLPLFYDVMGTGFIRAKGEVKEQRPAPLRHAHIQAFRNRSLHGLGRLNPDELDKLYEQQSVSPDFFAQAGVQGTRAVSVAGIQYPLTRNGDTTRNAVAVAHEFFVEDSDSSAREVTLNRTEINFGYTQYATSSDPQTITMTNSANGKVVVVWYVPRAHSPSKASTDNEVESTEPAFEVDPPTAEISTGRSMAFRITFKPMQSSRNFVSQIEAFVYFKNQRTFRLVNDSTMNPPWSFAITAMGHTFSSGQLLAKAHLSGNSIRGGKLIFPPCFAGESIYQTVMLRNTSNLPSTFSFELGWEGGDIVSGGGGSSNVQNDVFAVKPRMGEVAADDFILLCIRFSPTAQKKYTQLLRCIVNGDHGGRLLLEGTGGFPFVHCPDVASTIGAETVAASTVLGVVPAAQQIAPRGFLGSFFLKPTCIGLSSSRLFPIVNGSRLPVKFRVSLAPEAIGELKISPTRGLLRGNEQTFLNICFAPRTIGTSFFKMKILTFPVGGRANRVIDARQPGEVEPPEIIQNITVVVVSPSEMGAVTFDPPRLAMSVRLVNTEETKDMFLENISDSDVRYELWYRVDFTADNGALEKSRTVSKPMPLIKYEKRDDGAAAEGGNRDTDKIHSLCCDAPQDVLPARSRTRIPFTFRPSKAGLFEFLIFAKLQAIEPNGQPKMMSNEEAALLRTCDEDRENAFDQNEISFDDVRDLMPLTSVAIGRATFPTVLFEDIRLGADSGILVTDIDQLWRQFSLASLNYDLSMPLTEDEVRFNSCSTPDLSKLKHYAFEFTPGIIGSPTQHVYIQLRNHGFLTTSFHIHFPNEKQLRLEQWCEEDEATEDHNRIISILEEICCFKLEPQHGTLLPGESITLVLSYAHSSLKYDGIHKISVQLKLDQGKQLFIDLIGRTVPLPNTASTALTTSRALTVEPSPANILLRVATGVDGNYHFAPVPIGLSVEDAPRQRMELVNVSAVPARYEVDHQSISQLLEDNHGLPLVRIANPLGIVPALGAINLDWYFYPLEAKIYELPLVIKYLPASEAALSFAAASPTPSSPGARRNGRPDGRGGSDSVAQFLRLTLHLQGYDPRIARPVSWASKFAGGLPPVQQLVPLPSQFAFLSADVVEFGTVPQHSISNRLVVLRNDLEGDSKLEFSLSENSRSYLVRDGLLTINPSKGKIEPGGQVVFDIKFTAKTLPIIFEDCVKISVKEIIKVAAKKRRSAANSILDRVRQSKTVAPATRESVVSRCPVARRTKLEDSDVPLGRTANMPTTMTVNGEIVYFRGDPKTAAAEAEAAAEMFVGGDYGSASDDESLGANQAEGFPFTVGSQKSVSRGALSRQYTEESAYTASSSPTRSRAASEIGSENSRHRGLDRGKVGRVNFFNIRIKGEVCTMKTAESLLSRGPSLNPAKDFVVPPRPPFIAPLEIATLSSADLEPTNEKHLVTQQPSPPKSRIAANNGGETTISRSVSYSIDHGFDRPQPQFVSNPGTGVNTARPMASPLPSALKLPKGSAAVTQPPMSARSGKSATSFAPTMGTASTAGSAMTKLKKHIGVDKKREPEVRDVAEFVMGDLFRDILHSVPMEEYVIDVLKMAPPKGGLKFTGDMISPPQGRPLYGVYYQEVVDTLPVHSKLIRELKHLGYEDCSNVPTSFVEPIPGDDPANKGKGVLIDSSIVRKSICLEPGSRRMSYLVGLDGNAAANQRGNDLSYISGVSTQFNRAAQLKEIDVDVDVPAVPLLGKGTSRRTPVVDGILAQWTEGDTYAMLADESHYSLKMKDLFEGLVKMGILPNSTEYRAFDAEILARLSKIGSSDADNFIAPIASIVKKLPQSAVDALNRRLAKVTRERKYGEKLSRKAQLGNGGSYACALDGSNNRSLTNEFSKLSLPSETAGSSTSWLPKPPSPLSPSSPFSRGPSSPSSPKSKKRPVKRSEQVGMALVNVTSPEQEKLDSRLREALLQDGFLELAADIMRNTMFNLMQEAVFGEFDLMAEPIKFVFKP